MTGEGCWGGEGPLEVLEEEDGRLLDDAIELEGGVRTIEGNGDPAEWVGFPEWGFQNGVPDFHCSECALADKLRLDCHCVQDAPET